MVLQTPSGSSGAASAAMQQPLNVDEIRKRMADLKAKVLQAIEYPSPKQIAGEVASREERVQEDARILPLLKEAQEALGDFEILLEQRMVTDKEHLKEFKELQSLVETLKQQRDEAVHNFDNLEQTLKDAERIKQQHMLAEVEETTSGFLKQVEALEAKKVLLGQQKAQLDEQLKAARTELEQIVANAQTQLTPEMVALIPLLQSMTPGKLYQEFIANVEVYKKQIGWFNFKERSIVNQVLAQKQQFLAVDKKIQDFNAVSRDYAEAESKVAEALEQYKTRIVSTGEKEFDK